ncbi:MAG TPA: tRNA (adenosine(37)-N6)-threonylcarbamoyltransferase complex dimerization subunit type 1 TsaB [Bacillota bacterium]|nr:tRNA (adenosine(37)-N6)-threonylcarbamoyltransferase complex dimerization subunit type 1 TsaB [Bacillota bacterium]
MLTLAVDSSAKVASVAVVCDDGTPLGIVTLSAGFTHSETLLPAVEFLFNSLRISAADLGLFACAAGPGSFTGVRIGVSTIKGLAFGRGVPCAAVSTLEALAEATAPLRGLSCAVMDARREQVYAAVFDCRDGTPKRITPDEAIPIDVLAEKLREIKSETRATVYISGDGATIARKHPIISTLAGDVPPDMAMGSAYNVAICALRMHKAGLTTDDAGLYPIYLRPPQAEREYAEKHKNDNNI